HALHQGRCAGVNFAAAGFTNLTGDHLDYHRTMEDYAAAKAELFHGLRESAPAVVNGDDPASARMVQGSGGRPVRFSVGGEGDYAARDLLVTAAGSKFILKTPDGEAPVEMSLVGKHNVQNAL